MHDALYRYDLWAAAYLIGGGCSDDGFIDFRAGLIAQGRDWYHKAAASPDSLAGHPAVADARHPRCDNPLFYEEVNYAASHAFQQVSGDDNASGTRWMRAGHVSSSRSWVRTSTSMTTRRCAAACPGSPDVAWAAAPGLSRIDCCGPARLPVWFPESAG
jgi:hypothetical protein